MKTATRLLAALALLLPLAASAQIVDVTLRESNAVAQSDIDQLIALGANATTQQVDDLTHPMMEGQIVRFTAVVLTNPYNSGNSSWNPDINQPNRVHIFVRDTNAVQLGNEGMVGQIVDGSGLWEAANVRKNRVYTIEAEVTTFDPSGAGVTIQYSPIAYQDEGPYQALGLPDSILDPITVTTDEVTNVVGGLMLVDWATYNDYNSNYLRFENALVVDNAVGGNERVNYQWQSSGTDALVNSGDISLRFRNDRDGVYPDSASSQWNTRPETNPFIPPAIGAVINVQGFAVFPTFDFNNAGALQGSFYAVHPFEDSDLESLESPPVFGEVMLPDGVPGNAPVTVSIEVTPSAGRTITSVVLDYAFSGGASGMVSLSDNGSGIYSGDIPVAPDGDFVTFTITATDSNGDSSTTDEQSYRVLYGGITSIEHVQLTPDALPGPSPFNGLTTTTDINIEAVVQEDFVDDNGIRFLILQDDETLAGWTGIWAIVGGTDAVAVGDRVTITGATIEEFFGLTQLDDLTYSVTGSGATYGYKVVPTGVLNGDDPSVQEAHEGMLLRFDNVIVTDVNADGPDTEQGFGEFQVSSDGTEANEIRVDDYADAIPQDFNITNLSLGATIEFIQGPWFYSFGNFKLTPTSLDDIGMITVGNEPVGPAVPGTYRLLAAYPNPFNPAATIRYEIGAAGPVTLKVYDTLGREVATLVDGELAPSTYEATFDARGLASGVYVYRLTAGGQVLTGQMTLLK